MKKLILLSVMTLMSVGVFAATDSSQYGEKATGDDGFLAQGQKLQRMQILQGQIAEESALNGALQVKLAAAERDKAAVGR